MPKTIVHLGKTGDLCNLLPMLRMEEQRTRLMVAAEFAPLLEGVSYVEPMVWPGHYSEIDKACDLASRINGGQCLCTQVNAALPLLRKYVYEPAGLQQAVTTSFAKESWRVADRLSAWDDQQPLVFDRRNMQREQALLKEVAPPNKKNVLFFAGGVSSPFPYAKILRELLRANVRNTPFNLIDLSNVKAERFYDLLALYERAVCLITTDSAPLHLARATPDLPVFAFTNDKPLLWNGSPWRPNHVFHCRYSDFPDRVEEFAETLHNSKLWSTTIGKAFPAIVHVWNAYAGRKILPEWQAAYRTVGQWRVCPVERGACGRDSQINLNDDQRVPFLKDALRMGLQMAGPKDWVCLTRPDTKFSEQIGLPLMEHERTFAYRMKRKDGRSFYEPVADLFCARRDWWKSRLGQIPDLVWGRDRYWPHVLWALFNQDGAFDATGMVWRDA